MTRYDNETTINHNGKPYNVGYEVRRCTEGTEEKVEHIVTSTKPTITVKADSLDDVVRKFRSVIDKLIHQK